MKYNDFDVGTKFRYLGKDYMTIDTYFDCGGFVMIVKAVRINRCNVPMFLKVKEFWDCPTDHSCLELCEKL